MRNKPYAGNGKPFVYAAFAHEDSEAARSVLENMADRGYSIWPTSGYEKRRIDKAALILLFLSPAAAADETIGRAINFAVQKDKAMLIVHLMPTELSPAQQLMLNTLQGILRYDCASDDAFFEKLYGSALLQDLKVTPAQKRAANLTNWGIGGGVLLAAAAAVLFLLQSNAKVPDDSLAAQLGYGGRMKDITSVLMYGETIAQSRSENSFLGKGCNWEQEQWYNTILYGSTREVAPVGEISDISDFAQLKNLTELSIAGNQVSDISPLFKLSKLEFLDIAGNPVTDLSGIEALKLLRTLCIADTQVDSLLPLDGCKSLQTVYVDENQYAAFSGDNTERTYALVEVGPKEDLLWLELHIFGGNEEHGNPNIPYSIYVQTRSLRVYHDYRYALYKNGEPVQITELEREPIFDNGTVTKLHLFLNQTEFGAYDPSTEYILVVSYADCSATYRIWHKYDDTRPDRTSRLIDSSGF